MTSLFISAPFYHLKPRHPAAQISRVAKPVCVVSLPVQRVAIAVALPAIPIVAYSEYVLLTTGCGLPPGPSGILGAAEGVSYLVVGAVVIASLYSKITTGKGLPEGPGKLLGAVEGVSFLLALLGVFAAGYTAYKYGALPNAVPEPGSRCFPKEQI